MAVLLIDVGNTSTKSGFWSGRAGDEALTAYSLPSDTSQSGDSLGLQLRQLAEHAGVEAEFGPVTSVLVSSVVPGMDPLIRHACRRFLGVTARFAHQDVPVPLENRYERPHEVGADRLVAAYAAHRLVPEAPAVISVDFGTATTFDCVRGTAYVGGLICPGMLSALGALSARTAKLPRIALETETGDDSLSPGRSTATSLSQGFLFGFAAMAEGLVDRLRKTLPNPCPVLATGGYAEDVARLARPELFLTVRPELILDGLRLLAEHADLVGDMRS